MLRSFSSIVASAYAADQLFLYSYSLRNPESISLLMISFAQASVLRPEGLMTAGSGRIQDEHWKIPTIIAISHTHKYNLSFYQDRYNTGFNMVPELCEHKITTNALMNPAQTYPGVLDM